MSSTSTTTYDWYEKKFNEYSEKFDLSFDETLEDVALDNVRLKDALKSQLKLQLIYESMHNKVKHLYDMLKDEVDTKYSEAISVELRDSYRDTTITEAKEYAKGNKEYRKYKRLLLDVSALKDDTQTAVETVNSRKYILNNLTNAVVSANENHLL